MTTQVSVHRCAIRVPNATPDQADLPAQENGKSEVEYCISCCRIRKLLILPDRLQQLAGGSNRCVKQIHEHEDQ